MKKNKDKAADHSGLRSRAEERLKNLKTGPVIPRTEESTKKLLHELQVHQIELEMQNEELRQSREESETALERYTELYDFAPVGFFTLDKDGIISSVNLTGASLLGTDRSRLIKKSFKLFITVEDRPVFVAFLKKVFEGKEKESCEVRLREKENQSFFVYIEAKVLIAGHKCYAILVDITGRRQAEEELKKLNKELEATALKLDLAYKDMESFSYSVSHDLRAPLRIIGSMSGIVLKDYYDKLDDEGRKLLNSIQGNTKKMDKLVLALLDLSKVGRQEMRIDEIDMEKEAALIAADLKAAAPERNITVTLKDLPSAYGDITLVRQVLANLLSNAVKFTRNRDVPVIEIGGRREDNENVYFVKDNGAGFDMDYANKLFGVFQRLHREKEFEGIGIGLSIVQRIVKRHGGRVWAEGRPNEGATFYFSLPLKVG